MRTIPIIIVVITISVAGIILVSMSIDTSNMISSNVTKPIDEPNMISSNVTKPIDEPNMISSNVTISNSTCPDNQCAIAFPIINATIPKDIAKSNNEFAIKFYKQISSNENVFFSPTSMYITFSILYEGAREETAVQIQQVFGFEPDMYTRHNATAHMMSSIDHYGNPISKFEPDYASLEYLSTIGPNYAVWVADWINPFETYLDTIRRIYFTNIGTVNFKNVEIVDFADLHGSFHEINAWMAHNTLSRFREATRINYDNDTAMVVTNAIYFNKQWLVEFPRDNMRIDDFWITSEDNARISFIGITDEFYYKHFGTVEILKIPYSDDKLSMLVILPDKIDGITTLEDTISTKQIAQWINDLKHQEVIVTMPRFEIYAEYDLNNYLIEQGMPNVFDKDSANLKDIGISDKGNIYVDKAVQKAYFHVDGAGKDVISVTNESLEMNRLPHFFANHPFIFIIYDEDSGTILFMGKVVDPRFHGRPDL